MFSPFAKPPNSPAFAGVGTIYAAIRRGVLKTVTVRGAGQTRIGVMRESLERWMNHRKEIE